MAGRDLKGIHSAALRLHGNRFKTELLKKTRLVCKGKYFGNTQRPCLVKAGIHKHASHPFPARPFAHSQRPYLPHILPAYVKGTGTVNGAIFFIYIKVPEVIIYISQRPVKHLSLTSVYLDKFVYILDIIQFCFSYHLPPISFCNF